jgi:hypothetical protein
VLINTLSVTTSSNTDNFDGDGGTEAAVEATDNTSPDSGSFSEHCDQISHQEELNKRLLTTNKRQQANNIRQRIPSGLLDTIEAGLGASRQETSSERTPLLGGNLSDKR